MITCYYLTSYNPLNTKRMKRSLLLLLTIFFACAAQAQQIQSCTSESILRKAASPDTVYVINFWATWCIPCVQELPEFNALNREFGAKPVKIFLVSLDFKEDYPFKLAAFVERKRLTPEVLWLSETDPNIFIPKIEESWEGSIPATLIIQPGHFRKFIEGQISAEQVSKIIQGQLNNK